MCQKCSGFIRNFCFTLIIHNPVFLKPSFFGKRSKNESPFETNMVGFFWQSCYLLLFAFCYICEYWLTKSELYMTIKKRTKSESFATIRKVLVVPNTKRTESKPQIFFRAYGQKYKLNVCLQFCAQQTGWLRVSLSCLSGRNPLLHLFACQAIIGGKKMVTSVHLLAIRRF